MVIRHRIRPSHNVFVGFQTGNRLLMDDILVAGKLPAFILCLAALCMLLGVIPTGKEEAHE